MFKFIKNLFPPRIKTLDEFIALVKQEGCSSVIVEPMLSVKNTSKSTSIGKVGNFQHFLRFTSKTTRRKKAVYNESSFQRFGSDQGVADLEERNKADIKSFLIGEKRMKYVKSKLPGVTVCLIGPEGRPMDNILFERLHKKAARVGLF